MKTLYLTILLTTCTLLGWGQSVQWTSFENLNDSLRNQPKPLLIFIEAEWCKYCKLQDNTTFKDPQLVALLNEEFYCLRFDGESRLDIPFLNRTYQYNATSGYHDLAQMLGKQNGEVIFPTTVLLPANLQKSHKLLGLQPTKYLLRDLELFVDQNP